MQMIVKLGYSLVVAVILFMAGHSYEMTNAQFEETYYLYMDLINGQENQFIPGQMEYKIDDIQTNATDLQGIYTEQTQLTGVTIDDEYLNIAALLNLPLTSEQNKYVNMDIAAWLEVTSIDELRDTGLKVYMLTKTPNNYYIGGHLVIDGALTQTSDDEATLSLRISQ